MTDNEFNRISEQYIDIVYRSAINICKNKSDAEDAVQNTFLKLLKSDIDFENEDHIRRWLIRVAVNECKNIWKSPWNKKISSFEELEKEPVYIENEKSELFAEVMSLPQKYSIVLHLYYYEDYSVREISRILGISETNVQTRLMRARKKLRVRLKEAWNDEQI